MAQAVALYAPQMAAPSAALKELVELFHAPHPPPGSEQQTAQQKERPPDEVEQTHEQDLEHNGGLHGNAEQQEPEPEQDEEQPPLTPVRTSTPKVAMEPAEECFWSLFGRLCGALGDEHILNTVARQLLQQQRRRREEDSRTIHEEVQPDRRT